MCVCTFTSSNLVARLMIFNPRKEKITSFLTVGVTVRTYLDRKAETQKRYLRFIDSYRFMAASLEKLAGSLPDETFKTLDRCSAIHSTEDRSLLHQKRYCGFSYFDEIQDEKLPSRYQWTDLLSNKAILLMNGNMPKRCMIDSIAQISVIITTLKLTL